MFFELKTALLHVKKYLLPIDLMDGDASAFILYFDYKLQTAPIVTKQDSRCRHTYVYIVRQRFTEALLCRQFIRKIHI